MLLLLFGWFPLGTGWKFTESRWENHPTMPGRDCVKTSCGVCLQRILDGKEEAIFCEGLCQQWYHRGYVSVPREFFATLTASNAPFHCLTCSHSFLQQEFAELTRDSKYTACKMHWTSSQNFVKKTLHFREKWQSCAWNKIAQSRADQQPSETHRATQQAMHKLQDGWHSEAERGMESQNRMKEIKIVMLDQANPANREKG